MPATGVSSGEKPVACCRRRHGCNACNSGLAGDVSQDDPASVSADGAGGGRLGMTFSLVRRPTSTATMRMASKPPATNKSPSYGTEDPATRPPPLEASPTPAGAGVVSSELAELPTFTPLSVVTAGGETAVTTVAVGADETADLTDVVVGGGDALGLDARRRRCARNGSRHLHTAHRIVGNTLTPRQQRAVFVCVRQETVRLVQTAVCGRRRWARQRLLPKISGKSHEQIANDACVVAHESDQELQDN